MTCSIYGNCGQFPPAWLQMTVSFGDFQKQQACVVRRPSLLNSQSFWEGQGCTQAAARHIQDGSDTGMEAAWEKKSHMTEYLLTEMAIICPKQAQLNIHNACMIPRHGVQTFLITILGFMRHALSYMSYGTAKRNDFGTYIVIT